MQLQHKSFNELLNGLVYDTDPRNAANVSRDKPRVQIVYLHRREVDKFYELPSDLQDRLPSCVRALLPNRHTVKVRVTYDQKTGNELSKIVKARVSDLDIYFPDLPLDCRISVNLEMPWEGDAEELEHLVAQTNRERSADRNKDRLSYSQGHYQVDLTQVTQKVSGANVSRPSCPFSPSAHLPFIATVVLSLTQMSRTRSDSRRSTSSRSNSRAPP